ncbi:MAG: adenosine deaminase [Gammaproteobacteria bacterium]|nr:adenosine deaminase [Gammaproteobacteria bacterium]|tara:strand:+ start:11982 stop:12440 length:459 start_codon:yes stop_codon:yes gene_type:complete
MLSKVSKDIFNTIIKLSEENIENNQIPIAAIIHDYVNNKIISQAVNIDTPIGHAELLAIEEALRIKKSKRLDDCDIYVTIEPCLMCSIAISRCHFRRLYFGAEDKKAGGIINGPRILDQPNMKQFEIISHIEEEYTAELMKKFFRSKRKGTN